MTLWNMWELIQYIANKDYSGNVINPDQFNQIIKAVNLDLFKKKMGLPEDYQLGSPISREYSGDAAINIDDLSPFKVFVAAQAVAAGIIAYPSNFAYRNAITYNYQRNVDGTPTTIPKPVEILREDQLAARKSSWIKKPSTKNPVGVVRSDGIHIFPTTIAAVDFNYYKIPADPVFAYTQFTGYITYDSGNSTEFEWKVPRHMDLVRYICSYVGINLREEQLYSYAEQKKNEGV